MVDKVLETLVGEVDESEHTQYWAARDADEITARLKQVSDIWQENFEQTDIGKKVVRSADYYASAFNFEADTTSRAIKVSGDSGEIVEYTAQLYSYYVQQLLTLLTSEMPEFGAVAANIDGSSRQRARAGDKALEYYFRRAKVYDVLVDAARDALVYGTGFVHRYWDSSLGKKLKMGEEGQEEEGVEEYYEGDVRVERIDYRDIIWEPARKNEMHELTWIAYRHRHNKYDLAVSYPDLRDEILSTCSDDESISSQDPSKDDYITLVTFYHFGSDALPDGRLLTYVENDDSIILEDLDYPFETRAIDIIRARKVRGTLCGWSPLFDVQPQIEAINFELSKILTAHDALAAPIVSTGLTSRFKSIDRVIGAPSVLETDEPPKITFFGEIPEDVFRTIDQARQLADTILGLNSAVLGEAKGSVRANNMQLYMSEQAIRYQSQMQAQFYALFESTGMAILSLLRSFATNQRVVSILGPGNALSYYAFEGSDLLAVRGVVVKPISTMLRTTEGRLSAIKSMADAGVSLIKEEVVSIIKGAPLEVITGPQEAQLEVAMAENDFILSGGVHRALLIDNHILHIRRHAEPISNPSVRSNQQYVQGFLAAVMEHIDMYNDMAGYQIQAMLGYASIPPLNMAAQQAPGGGPQGEPLPPPGAQQGEVANG